MKNIALFVSLLIATLFVSCTPFKISMSEGLSAANELPVKGRNGILINQKLSFGEYRTGKVKRSWTEKESEVAGDKESIWVKTSESKQRIHYTLSDSSGNSSDVFCITSVSSEDWSLGENPNSPVNIVGEVLGLDGPSENTYAVNIRLNGTDDLWRMRINLRDAERKSKKYTGLLALSKDMYYTLHPITNVEKNGKKAPLPMGAIGFEFRNTIGKAVAAVSLIDNGKVYISSADPREKFLLANACAAILLHQVIDN